MKLIVITNEADILILQPLSEDPQLIFRSRNLLVSPGSLAARFACEWIFMAIRTS